MSVSPDLLDTIASEIMNKYKDKAPSGQVLRGMLVEAAKEGYDECLLESLS